MNLTQRTKLFEEVIAACRSILKTDIIAADAREYLNARVSEEYQEKFEFGYFPPDDQLGYLTSILPDQKILEQLLLVYPKSISGGSKLHGQLNDHNLIMPFRDVHGNVISLLGRTLQSSNKVQKYKYTLGAHKYLYIFGLDKAKQSIIEKNYVICMEGQFDCIACHANGIHNVVALGWANCSQYQFFQLHRYTNNLVILLDNDDAGSKAKLKIKDRFADFANVKPASPPKGFKDIDEFLRNVEDQNRKNSIIDNLNNIKF